MGQNGLFSAFSAQNWLWNNGVTPGNTPVILRNIGNIPRDIPVIPRSIGDIPRNIPDILGSIGNIPGSIPNIPGSAGNTPGGIGVTPGVWGAAVVGDAGAACAIATGCLTDSRATAMARSLIPQASAASTKFGNPFNPGR